MALARQFQKGLQALFARRTAWLLSAVGRKRPGPAPKFTRAKVKPKVERLVALAREILIRRRARQAFANAIVHKAAWRVKGVGVRARTADFKRWYDRKIGRRNCVYTLWAGRRCMYVGRTERGKGRPTHCFDKYWFRGITRIDVFSIRSPKRVPMAECLATHLFEPRKQIQNPGHIKYAIRCPVCSVVKDIKSDLRGLFKLRA